jgi:outer membrane cobalamin receptor
MLITQERYKFQRQVFNESKLASYFGRVQYKLMDRYLLTGTLRRDGSSNFGRITVGELFYFGLGWIVSNGDFMANVKNRFG